MDGSGREREDRNERNTLEKKKKKAKEKINIDRNLLARHLLSSATIIARSQDTIRAKSGGALVDKRWDQQYRYHVASD